MAGRLPHEADTLGSTRTRSRLASCPRAPPAALGPGSELGTRSMTEMGWRCSRALRNMSCRTPRRLGALGECWSGTLGCIRTRPETFCRSATRRRSLFSLGKKCRLPFHSRPRRCRQDRGGTLLPWSQAGAPQPGKRRSTLLPRTHSDPSRTRCMLETLRSPKPQCTPPGRPQCLSRRARGSGAESLRSPCRMPPARCRRGAHSPRARPIRSRAAGTVRNSPEGGWARGS
mmetsp:Transcript_14321/g.34651  ORF Transcript_14321/g.34651 Transcript_14321/m.34651 type:complete len:230 (-) Transcript_14321:448-1137(-)